MICHYVVDVTFENGAREQRELDLIKPPYTGQAGNGLEPKSLLGIGSAVEYRLRALGVELEWAPILWTDSEGQKHRDRCHKLRLKSIKGGGDRVQIG